MKTTPYNKKRLFKRAWFLFREGFMTFSECLKQVWQEAREYRAKLKAEADYKERNRLDALNPKPFKPLDCSNYYNRPSGTYYGD